MTINITSTMANSINSLRLSNAQKAFQSAARPVEEIEKELVEDKWLIEKPASKISPDAINEMKEISMKFGETLSDDDIQYGIQYGRSVIADYSV